MADISRRKKDHLKIALSPEAQIGNSGFDKYRFVHNALPEINYDQIDTSTVFLGKKINYPFFISCMSGGTQKGELLNKNLAKAAQKYKIPMGVGSQRAALENPKLTNSFKIRKIAADIPIMANIGLVQLNYGLTYKDFEKVVDMIDADALVVHLNPIQEVIQEEGDRNFSNLLMKMERVVNKLNVPVIVKEVGFGLSEGVVSRLLNVGVRIFDTAGWGGTNWSMVEGLRSKANQSLGRLFSNWGITTTESIKHIKKVKDRFDKKNKNQEIQILGSGGVRNGIDIAKTIALGADLAGIATPFAQAGLVSTEAVEKLIDRLAVELKTAMFGIGVENIKKLKKAKLIEFNPSY